MKARLELVGVLAVGLALAMSGCMGQWFRPRPTLIIGDPVISGGTGTVLISVANMPEGGLASIAVGPDGMAYDQAKIKDITITGKSGFVVLASEFDDATGKGRFVLANPAGGCKGGVIAQLDFVAQENVTSADFAFAEEHIDLGSAANRLILDWELAVGTPYYAR